MPNSARVVIGANFGDEGKGITTDYLCSLGTEVVVRFNGGAQAGHTVVTPTGERHVFHHIGSGMFQGIPTFLSQFFVCNPILFFQELKEVAALGYKPTVFAHPDCLITTFPDMLINQTLERKLGDKRHGSCGVGINETMNRSKIKSMKITMGDLWDGGKRLEEQLDEICGKYAEFRTGKKINEPKAIEMFIDGCRKFAEHVHPAGIGHCKNPVFEGAQGLLLDQGNKQYFPHVTRSNTGMKNVRVLCQQAGITDVEIHYVSRTYLTRHGAGPLPGEDTSLKYHDNTNNTNEFQGSLRFAPLDYADLVKRCKADAGSDKFKMVMTHCDQLAPTVKGDVNFHGVSRESVEIK